MLYCSWKEGHGFWSPEYFNVFGRTQNKFILINVYLYMCATYVEIKCQLDATEVFIADLIACSTCFGHHHAHHQELNSIIRWLLSMVFRAVVFKLLVWCGSEGYVSGLQDAALSSNLQQQPTTGSNHCLILLSS